MMPDAVRFKEQDLVESVGRRPRFRVVGVLLGPVVPSVIGSGKGQRS